jgi:hypothetical protein
MTMEVVVVEKVTAKKNLSQRVKFNLQQSVFCGEFEISSRKVHSMKTSWIIWIIITLEEIGNI